MPDFLTPAEPGARMALIRSRGNRSTEARLAGWLREHGITGWRRHLPLPGRPDFAFPKARLAVFVDGCFWHGCPAHSTRPRTRREFWDAKIARNQARDRRVSRELRARGWRVLRLWEHALRVRQQVRTMGRLLRVLAGACGSTSPAASGLHGRS